MLIYAAAAFLLVLFLGLGLWQRRIDRREQVRVRAEIAEARSLGADRPLAQHPVIDPQACIGCASCIRACPEDGVLGLVGGVAHVVQGARCIGHGRCEEACPVGALVVGLGDTSRRTDLPLLSDEMETSVPGIFVAGELAGLALIRNAVRQGVQAVDVIAERVRADRRREPGLADLLVVGAGPCGFAAALRAREHGLACTTISRDDLGGTVRKYPRRKLVMTQPLELPVHGSIRRTEFRKEELVALFDDVAREAGIEVAAGVALEGARREGDHFVAETTAGPVRARHLLLAIGRRGTPRRLDVPGEEQEKVLYQLVDAATYTGLDLLVVGGGDSAIEAATALANQAGNRVTLSYRKEAFFRAKARNLERIAQYGADGRVRVLFSSHVRSIGAEEVVLGTAAGATRLRNDYTFVFAGGEPPYPLLRSLGVRFGGQEEAA